MGAEQGGYIEEGYGGDSGFYVGGGGGDSFSPDYGGSDYYYGGSGGDDWDWEDYIEAGGTSQIDGGYVDLPTFSQDPWAVDTPIFYPSDPFADFEDIGFVEQIQTGAPAPLPDIGNWPSIPYPSGDYYNYEPWESPPYIPPIIDQPAPPPPAPLPQSPASQQSNLPPPCPAGKYHPYPIGHPSQNVCVPFPAAQQQAPQQQPKPSGGASSGGSKPQQQQQPTCPTYCKHPQTGQWFKTPSGYHCDPVTQKCTPNAQQQQACPSGQVRNPSTGQCVTVPSCPTPGTVFDARTGRCVPFAQAQQPLCPPGYTPNYSTQRCEIAPTCSPGLVFDPTIGFCVQPSQLPGSGEFDDVLNSLKTIPWWVWAALGGFFVLSRKNEDGRTTTVRYRRASA